jgi:acyl-CoA thioester hydrolase
VLAATASRLSQNARISAGFRPIFLAGIAALRYGQFVTATALPYQFQVDVAQDDIDFMGHVNNASYLKWVQAAVISHWQAIAPVEAVAQHLWVALKHEITYRRPAFLEDDVVATVLLEKVQGARAFYETVIKRGGEVLAEVKSSWCCLDAETLRPARLTQNVIDKFFVTKSE